MRKSWKHRCGNSHESYADRSSAGTSSAAPSCLATIAARSECGPPATAATIEVVASRSTSWGTATETKSNEVSRFVTRRSDRSARQNSSSLPSTRRLPASRVEASSPHPFPRVQMTDCREKGERDGSGTATMHNSVWGHRAVFASPDAVEGEARNPSNLGIAAGFRTFSPRHDYWHTQDHGGR